MSADPEDPNAPGDRKVSLSERSVAIRRLLDAHENLADRGAFPLIDRDRAESAIEAILDMASCHRDELAGVYAQGRLCAAIGLKAFTFSEDEAIAIDAHRKLGSLDPNGPFKSSVDAVRDRELVRQVGETLSSIMWFLNGADLVVAEHARRIGISTEIHKVNIAMNRLRALSKQIEVLPFMRPDEEPGT